MPPETNSASRRRATGAHRRRRVVLLLLLVAAVLALHQLYRHYTNPARIRAVAESYLQHFVRGKVSVGSASFSWVRGVRLLDVVVDEVARSSSSAEADAATPERDPVFSCPEVRLTQDSLSALFGNLRIRSIVAIEPVCLIARDAVDGHTNLADLFRPLASIEAAGPAHWPTVELSDARIQVWSRAADHQRLVDDLRITLRALPVLGAHPRYDVVWKTGDGGAVSGHSQIDLTTGDLLNVRGGLPTMSIEAVMLAINAKYDGAGAWCDLLGLDGTVRAKDYDLRHGTASEETPSATIELNDASLSIPINESERALPPDERYLRFEHVHGNVRLTGGEIRAAFDGRFHDSVCDVVMTLKSGVGKLLTLDDVHVDARLSLQGLELPQPDPSGSGAEARFIQRWPRLAHYYRDYSPSGLVDLDASVTKPAGKDQPFKVRRLVLNARGATASSRLFPYRVEAIEGIVEYNEDGVFVRNLHGRHGPGTVVVDAWAAKPTREAAKTVTIHGTGVVIDEALRSALPARYKTITDRFTPHGTIDVTVDMEQPESESGVRPKWVTRSAIKLRDVFAQYDGFPYPLDGLTGTLNVGPKRVEVIDIAGRSGQAHIKVNGKAAFSVGKLAGLDLNIEGTDVPFDEKLLGALPPATRRQVEAFHPHGRFDVATSVTFDPSTHKEVTRSVVTLDGVSCEHESLPLPLTDLLGKLHVAADEILIRGVTGHCQGATFSVEGSVQSKESAWSKNLAIRSQNVQLNDMLRKALPQKIQAALADWRIDGPIGLDATVTASPTSPQNPNAIRVVARLDGVTVGHERWPIPLSDVRADITIDKQGARAQGVVARYGPAKIGLDFDLGLGDQGETGKITLSAVGLPLDSSLRGLWPARAAAVWDRLHPGGSVNLYLQELSYRRPVENRPREWSVSGYAELHDVALAGLDLKGMSGTLTGSGALVDRLGGVALKGNLTLTSAQVLGQHLRQTEGQWSFARVPAGDGMLTLQSVRSDIYEGTLSGNLELSFDRATARYDLSGTVRGMQVQPFVQAEQDARPTKGEPADVRGLADAHLYLSGVVGDPLSWRGGGRVEIVDAHIYRLPIFLAILSVLNLAVPEENAFSNAETDFLIVGQRLQFENIQLNGSALALIGSGSMSLPDRGLDLGLVHVNPNRWTRVPVLTDILEQASHELVELHVTGPLSQPTVRAKPFRGVTDELKRLFRPRKKKKAVAAQSEKP